MSQLDLYRSQLQRERDGVAKDRRTIADASSKAVSKQQELSRAPSAARQRTLLNDLQRLDKTRADAEKSLAAREKRIADLLKRVDKGEASERDRAAKDQARQQRDVERRLRSTSSAVTNLEGRVTGIEDTLIAQVHKAVLDDPVARKHDVFLSHTGDTRDVEVCDELYVELTGRDLDVWYDGAELRLGESLMRQIDRGIAKSKCGVILITEAFLKGRAWTERELGALVSSGRRVIPILDSVSYEDLATYSPLLADRVGLNTESFGLGEIADQIAVTIAVDAD
jgi:TIR domain